MRSICTAFRDSSGELRGGPSPAHEFRLPAAVDGAVRRGRGGRGAAHEGVGPAGGVRGAVCGGARGGGEGATSGGGPSASPGCGGIVL